MRAAAEPQSEVRVRLLHLQLLHQLVKLRHPAQGQVTVGQEHPVTLQQWEIQKGWLVFNSLLLAFYIYHFYLFSENYVKDVFIVKSAQLQN